MTHVYNKREEDNTTSMFQLQGTADPLVAVQQLSQPACNNQGFHISNRKAENRWNSLMLTCTFKMRLSFLLPCPKTSTPACCSWAVKVRVFRVGYPGGLPGPVLVPATTCMWQACESASLLDTPGIQSPGLHGWPDILCILPDGRFQ